MIDGWWCSHQLICVLTNFLSRMSNFTTCKQLWVQKHQTLHVHTDSTIFFPGGKDKKKSHSKLHTLQHLAFYPFCSTTPSHPTQPNPSSSLTFWFSTCDLPPPFVSWSTPSLHQCYHLTQLPTVIPNVGMKGFSGFRLVIEDR